MSNFNKKKSEITYREAAYKGHQEHMQHNSNVRIPRASNKAKNIKSQNSTLFSARYTFYE